MMEEKKNIAEVNSILAKENTWFILHNIPQYFAISFLDFLQLNGPMLPNPENFNEAPMQNLFIEDSHPEIPSWSKIVILLLLRIFYWTFFGFVIYGLIKIIKNWEKAGVFIVFIVYFNLVYSAVFGIPRYALPIYPFYIILFVYSLSILLNYVNIRKNQINA